MCQRVKRASKTLASILKMLMHSMNFEHLAQHVSMLDEVSLWPECAFCAEHASRLGSM